MKTQTQLLKSLSGLNGLGKQILVAVDTEHDELRNICHFVRFETIRFNKDEAFGELKFLLPSLENDARIGLLVPMFVPSKPGSEGFTPRGMKVTAEHAEGKVTMTPGMFKGKKAFLIETEHFKTGNKMSIGCTSAGMKAFHECSQHMIKQL
jgi:hypothetical protein